MLKFTYLSKELFETVKSSLDNFKEVKNHLTGGDDDFVLLDEIRKEFSWFENGSIGVSDLIWNEDSIFGNSKILKIQDLIQKILEDSTMFED